MNINLKISSLLFCLTFYATHPVVGSADAVLSNFDHVVIPAYITGESGPETFRCLPEGIKFQTEENFDVFAEEMQFSTGVAAMSSLDHIPDFIAEMISVPLVDHSASGLSATLDAIPHATPADAISFIQPPTANAFGSANTEFLIQVPPGRQGMEPTIAIEYNSESGNSWLGLGWDLNIGNISVDTRWGVPRFSGSMETETYLLNEQQLAPVAHRNALESRTSEKQFHLRVEGSFQRIMRHGSNPKDYWWEVTDKHGVTRSFGGRAGEGLDPAAVLRDAQGNIAQWCLVEQRDPNDNYISYSYDLVQDPGVPGSNNQGYQIYPSTIRYTGHGEDNGPFSIQFIRDRDLGESPRPDIGISARWGFKQVAADLLRRVEVRYGDELIRSYEMTYVTGAFFKSLLKEMIAYDEKGQEFYRHSMDYHEDVRDGDLYKAFNAEETWDVPLDNIRGEILSANALFPNETSVLGGSSTTDWSVGGAVTVGFLGNLAAKTNTAGGNFNYGSASGQGLLAFADINGDGLPDKVYRKGDQLTYRPNTSNQTGTTAFGEERSIQGVTDFSRSKTDSYAIGVEAHPGLGFVGYTNTTVTTRISTYFSDFNGDGLIDIVFEGKVYFNHINGSGDPVFTLSSQDTPSPITVGASIDDDLFSIDPDELENKIDASPLHDQVRMWEAPFDGVISVHAPVRLLEDTSFESQAYTKKDGVRVAIQVNGTERWNTEIEADDFTGKIPGNVSSIQVDRGDRIYFRVQSRFDGAYDQVIWDPEISYLSQPIDQIDANAKPSHRYKASEDFILASGQVVSMPLDGKIRIEGLFTKPVTSDDVRMLIQKSSASTPITLFDTLFVWDSIVHQHILVGDIDVDENDEVFLKLISKTQVEWSAIQWMPAIIYTSADNGSPVTASDGTPLITYCPAPEYGMFNDPLSKTVPWIAPAGGLLSATVDLNFFLLPNGVLQLSLKGVKSLYDVVQVNVNNGNASMTGPLEANVAAGDTLYFEYHSSNRDLALLIQDADVEISLAGNSESVQAGLHTVRDEEDIIFGPMYRGWGHFVYNGNRDRAFMPINEGELMVDGDLEDQAGGIEDIEDPDDIGNVYNASDEAFIVMVSDPKNRYWVGSDNLTFIRTDTMSSSRLGEDDLLPNSFDSDGTVFNAPALLSKSYINSVAGGVSAGPVGAGGSVSFNTTENELDVIDLNGDRYPDIVTHEMIQYTDMLGGLEEEAITYSLGSHKAESFAYGLSTAVGYVYSSATNSGDISHSGRASSARGSMESSGSARSTSSKRSKSASSVKSNVTKSGKKSSDASRASKSSAGIDGGFTIDRDSTAQTWTDINGDGLIDMLFNDGMVALNLGYRFAEPEQWGFPVIREGDSRDYGGGLGVNLFNGSIVAGVSINRTDNYADQGLIDVNADGLVDLVVGIEPLRVRLNTGNGFAEPVTWGGAEFYEQGTATGESANAAFTVCVPIIILGIRICVNPSSSTGRGVSRITQQISDADGDGFPDYLRSENDGQLFVRRSTINRTNLLKSIRRPLGAAISLDYAYTGNTYNLPFGRWVLSEVEVDDGLAGDGADLRKTKFEYIEGNYHRHEREFLGFGQVKMHELDTENEDAIYRTTVYFYRNDNYYTKGLESAHRVLDAEDNPYYEIRNEYVLKDIFTGTVLPPIAATDDAGMAFPALASKVTFFYEGHADAGMQTAVFYSYDLFGNLIEYTDSGNGSPGDSFTAFISYHNEAESYIRSIPSNLDVVSQGTSLRNSEQDIDDRGNITQIRKFLSGEEVAISDMEYDNFGNLVGLIKPANIQGQRLHYSYTYDDEVNTYPVSTEDSYGYISGSIYNVRYGQLTESTDINGQQTVINLDEKGRIVTIRGPYELASGAEYSIAYDYNPEATPSYAITRRFDPEQERDILVLQIVDGLGRVVQTKKSGLLYEGGVEKEVSLVSGTDLYDPYGRVVGSYYPVTAPPGSTAYNTNNDAVTPTRISYDVLDRGTEFILPDGATTSVEYDILPDNAGTPQLSMATTDALGNSTAEFRDVRERVTSEMQLGPEGEVWSNFNYNAISELIEVIDAESNVTEYIYDRLGRRTKINHPDGGELKLNFDLAGNILSKETSKIRDEVPNSGVIEYAYDYERLLEINYPKNFQNKVQFHYGEPTADHNRAGRIWLREDASGGEEFFYGPQGETIKTIRTLLISKANIQTYVTEYVFDTWGRVQELLYPDGEKVEYGYNAAGMLKSMTGIKAGIRYPYLKTTGYDKFEEIVFRHFGNDTRAKYSYEPERRRMSGMEVTDASGMNFIDNVYRYDAVDNLLSLQNEAPASPGDPGGTTSHSYNYDRLYRLSSANGEWTGGKGMHQTYTLDMTYDNLHNILLKHQVIMKDGEVDALNSYRFEFDFEQASPHQPSKISGRKIEFDPSGNLLSMRGEQSFTFSQHLWDEENRLGGVSNNGYISRYTYDANGQRAIRSHGGQQGVFVNGAPAGAIDHQEEYTAYVNPYFSAEKNKFTKHYFAGEKKLLTKIGTGKFNFGLLPGSQGITAGGLDYVRRMQLLSQAQEIYYTALGVPPGPPTLPGYYGQPEYTGNPLAQGTGSYPNPPAGWPGPPGPPDPNGPPGPPVWYGEPVTRDNVGAGYGFDSTATGVFQEIDAFFYHKDHLGSSHYLTDWKGEIRQHSEYSPFGEVFVDENGSDGSLPYKFNGKELDEETGYYYFGARYYDPRLSLWQSVDPLSEQFPALSPYAFTFQNPLRYVDPDGRAPGDLFASPTKAAKDFAVNFNPVSIADNVEYGATIYTMTLAGKPFYSYSHPARSTKENGVVPSNAPSGFRVVADVHTHSAYSPDFDNDHFSPTDISDNDHQGIVGYVATPRGRLLKYDPVSGETSVVSKSIPFDLKHPKFKKAMKQTSGARKAGSPAQRRNAVYMRGSRSGARH